MFWYEHKAENKDVVVSTRVRLARNLREFPFANRLNDENATKIVGLVSDIYQDTPAYTLTNIQDISQTETASLYERHYISHDFANAHLPRMLVRNDEKGIAIMVGEEDHLRIQCLKNGLALEDAFKTVMEEESFLDEKLHFAYHENLGYLTHCLTNLGTAMRISVMMHLPALTMQGHIESLGQQLQKLGVVIRGMYGEGSRSEGCLYQISNQITMGITEEATLQKMSEIIAQISDRERSARSSFNAENLEKLLDRAQRAEGILRTARLISSSEFVSLYNAARLGYTIGNSTSLSYELLDTLFFEVMPATMSLAGYTDTDNQLSKEMQRDKNRAVFIQKSIAAQDKKNNKKRKSSDTPSADL